MNRRFRRSILFALSCIALAAAAAPARHARLLKSDPMADSTVVAPKAIRLWFSEKLDVGVSGVKLVAAGGAAVKTGALAYDGAADAKSPLVTQVMEPLHAGTYTVQWVAASGDGHPVKGEYSFTVKSP